jgi:hypothetical protein
MAYISIEEIVATSERIRRLELELAKPISPHTHEDVLQDDQVIYCFNSQRIRSPAKRHSEWP